jgi:hypothetical protein
MVAPVKARTGHLVIEGRKDFKELARVYPEIHRRVLEANRPFVKELDPMLPEVLLEENLRDLKGGRKPSGFNRQEVAGLRLVFPIREDHKMEFYVSRSGRCSEVVSLTETLSGVLAKAGFRHQVEYDRALGLPAHPGISGGYRREPSGTEGPGA